MLLKQILLVGLGGGVGSIFRYLVSRFTYSASDKLLAPTFPVATFIVNMVGCLLIGILIGMSYKYISFDNNLKLLLVTGFCGGFTTFSAFSLESLQLYQAGNYFSLIAYVLLSVVLGILLVWSGIILRSILP